MKKHIGNIIAIAAVIVLCVSLYQIYGILSAYKKGADLYSDTADNYVMESADLSADGETKAEEGDTPAANEEKKNTLKAPIKVDFDKLLEENPDTVGWLYQENTVINYPVVHRDNEFYLHHLFDGSYNSSGTLFTDEKNTAGFSDYNTIIYGHHMRNGAMLASIEQYKRDKDYVKDHKYFWLLTPDGNYRVTVIAAYTTSDDDDTYTIFTGPSDQYQEWLDKVMRKSEIETGEEVTTEDRCITLSTCDYSFQDARYVVIGKLEPAD